MKLLYNQISQEMQMEITRDTTIVCPHCQSGWVIITLGIKNHIVDKMSVCNLKEAKITMYCPYCGKDMTEIFRWKGDKNG